jgi:hypothetical protein
MIEFLECRVSFAITQYCIFVRPYIIENHVITIGSDKKKFGLIIANICIQKFVLHKWCSPTQQLQYSQFLLTKHA